MTQEGDYLNQNTLLFHITGKPNRAAFEEHGVRLQKGNVDAGGPGFYTVENINNVFQWHHAETPAQYLDDYIVVVLRTTTYIQLQVGVNPPPIGVNAPAYRKGGDLVWKRFEKADLDSPALDIKLEGTYTIREIQELANEGPIQGSLRTYLIGLGRSLSGSINRYMPED